MHLYLFSYYWYHIIPDGNYLHWPLKLPNFVFGKLDISLCFMMARLTGLKPSHPFHKQLGTIYHPHDYCFTIRNYNNFQEGSCFKIC